MMKNAVALLVLFLSGFQAAAQPIGAREAQGALFGTRGEVVFPEGTGLGGADQAMLRMLFDLSSRRVSTELLATVGVTREGFEAALEQFKATNYYGAMAASPARGLVTPATQMVQNLHGREAAHAAALAACRAQGGTGCVVVAEILPRRFSPRDFTLSQAATDDFSDFRRGAGPKALARSSSTSAYAITRGLGARRAAELECNRLAGRSDCEVVVYED